MTYIIIFVTVVLSIICFRDGALLNRLSMRPYAVLRNGQWDRLITHGFVHADTTHLLVNMFVFWSFGTYITKLFELQFRAGASSMNVNLKFILLYFGGMIAASVYDLIKYRKDPYYSSIGASGAVSAVLFASIFYRPLGLIYFFGVLPIPGIVFGILYIGYEWYSAKKQGGRVNHHAHIFGALYGFLFPIFTGGFSEIGLFIDALKF